MQTVNLDAEQYNDFLRCLTILKDICNDVDIQKGVIRQRIDAKTAIFQFDLNPIISDISFPISNLKKKLDLFKSFTNQDVTISVQEKTESEEGYYVVADQYSAIKFLFPLMEFMDNKYMPEDELTTIFNVSEDDLILENELNQIITERIKIVTANFNTHAIQVIFNGEKAAICAATQSKDQSAKIIDNIDTNVSIEASVVNLPTAAFSIEHDTPVKFQMFKDSNQPVTLNKLETKLGDIDINIFSRSNIMSMEDSSEE
jgi:hypothetical protein